MSISPPPFLPMDLGNEILMRMRREFGNEWSNAKAQIAMQALTLLMETKVPTQNGQTEEVSVLIARAFGVGNISHHRAWQCNICTCDCCQICYGLTCR